MNTKGLETLQEILIAFGNGSLYININYIGIEVFDTPDESSYQKFKNTSVTDYFPVDGLNFVKEFGDRLALNFSINPNRELGASFYNPLKTEKVGIKDISRFIHKNYRK